MNAKAIYTAKAAQCGESSARFAYEAAALSAMGDHETARRADERAARLSALAADYAKAARRAAH